MGEDDRDKPDDDRIARLSDPDVLAKVRASVPRDMQPADASDVVQKVFERLLLAPELPRTKDGLLGLAVVTTRHVAIDELRRAGRRAKKDIDVDGEGVEESLADAAEDDSAEAEQVRLLNRAVEGEIAKGRLTEDKRELARMLVAGMTPTQIARATGRPLGTVKSDVSRLKAHLAKYWHLYVGAAVIALVFYVARKYRTPGFEIGPDDLAMSASATASTARPATSVAPPDPQKLRDDARDMCRDGFYPDCEKDLDQAKALDPTGESLPYVKDMRATIAKWKALKSAPQDKEPRLKP
jgi:RNA polymerase sigma factor (sigma-70 family)